MMIMRSMLRLFCLPSVIAGSTIASSNVIIDHVSDDEYPNIVQRPIIKTAGGIKLTDSTTHTSSTSSSRKIKHININKSEQKLDNHNNEKDIINSSSRNLDSSNNVTNLWTMNDPTIDYSENQFDGTNRLRLGYTTSDMIDESMFTSTWWTPDCKAGGNKIETTGIGYRFIYTSPEDQLGDGTGTRKWYVAFEAAPVLLAEADEDSSIYKEYWQDGSKYGMAEVCVRVSLQTPAGIEVNYVENILTIHYYFSDGFYVLDDFNVERPEAEVTGIDMGSTLRAYDCSLKTTGSKSQGMVLRVCIEPMASAISDGIRMKAIETFSYEKYSTEDPDAEPFIQDAVIDSKQVENQLTLFTCVRGQEQCIIETMLMAIFYQTKGHVEGRGVATMQLGNFAGDDVEGVNRQRSLRSTTTPIRNKRQLLGGRKSIKRRNLQEQESDPEDLSEEFTIDFEVDDQPQNSTLNIGGNGSGIAAFHSISASIGILCLLLFNVFAVAMLVMQFPYFSGTRLYLQQKSMTKN